jgi:hypothetical protein
MHETVKRRHLTYALWSVDTFEPPSRAPKIAFHSGVGHSHDAVGVQEAEAFDHLGEQKEYRAS